MNQSIKNSTDISRDELLRLLSVDQQLTLYLDLNRRRKLVVLLQEASEIVQLQLDGKGVWIRFAGPRTFDGEPRQWVSIFSSNVPDHIQGSADVVAGRYRDENREAGHSHENWLGLETELDDFSLVGVPMFAEHMKVYIGFVCILDSGPPSVLMRHIANQAASRLDTTISFKNISSEHHTVIARSNALLDQDGISGLGAALILLQTLVRAPRAIMLYYDSPHFASKPAHERKVELLYAEERELAAPPEKSFVLHEGLGGNLIEFQGDLHGSRKAMMAMGILDRSDAQPRKYFSVTLKDRSSRPHRSVGMLALIGGPPLDQVDKDVVISIGAQVDTKIVHYHRAKRHLLRSLHPDQVEFFVKRPSIANWFFHTPRNEEIAMVFSDLCGYTEITRQLADPVETIRVAKEWIIHQIKLTSKHGGFFDKDVGDCAVSLFGPPFYELTLDSLLSISETKAIEQLMSDLPPDPERYAYQSVMYALDTMDAVEEFSMGGQRLHVSIGIEVAEVAIGDLNGNLGSLTAMGDGMNLAARLQGLAGKNQIIIGPNCRLRLEDYRRNNLARTLPFLIEEGSAADLKGYDEPVQYFFVSRDKESS